MPTRPAKTVLITGAASGIGLATARAFASRGDRIIACDINAAALEALAAELGPRCLLTAVVDVADRSAMAAFATKVHAVVPAVDILVNNAGVGLGAGILETPLSDWDWVIGVNLMGVVHGCHFFAPNMVAQARAGAAGAGHIVNVSSMMGFIASSQMGAYATTKFAVFGMSEALRGELAPHGIGVSTICPGMIATQIVKMGRFHGRSPAEVAKADALWHRRGFPPEKVARAIVDAVDHKRTVVPVAPESRVFWGLKRLAPDAAVKLLGRMSQVAKRVQARAGRAKT